MPHVLKKCNMCLKDLEQDNFYHNYAVCIPCSKQKRKDYYQKHKEHLCSLSRKNYSLNKEDRRSTQKEWRDSNKEKLQKDKKEWRDANLEKVAIKNKQWKSLNKDKTNAYFRTYRKERSSSDPLFKLSKLIRARFGTAFMRFKKKKTQSTMQWLGCSLEELKKYLESQFEPGMTWDNHGMWHIDHIVPLGSAKTAEELYKLSHYTNLQPLWAADNLRKGDSIESPEKEKEPNGSFSPSQTTNLLRC